MLKIDVSLPMLTEPLFIDQYLRYLITMHDYHLPFCGRSEVWLVKISEAKVDFFAFI
jgi:hypothetical protein